MLLLDLCRRGSHLAPVDGAMDHSHWSEPLLKVRLSRLDTEAAAVLEVHALRIECEMGLSLPRMAYQDLVNPDALHASEQGAPFTLDHRACGAERIKNAS